MITINKMSAGASIVLLGIFLTSCNASNNNKKKKKIVKKIRDVVTTTMKADKSPGMAVALIYKNKRVFSEGFGVTNIQTQQSVTADTSFWLGSVSKTAIAISLMHAQERGLLSLDDSVNQILKRQNDVSLSTPFAEPILLKHLANHTSSIIDSDAYECSYFVGDVNGQHYNMQNKFDDDSPCDDAAPVSLKGFLNTYLSDEGTYYSTQENFSTAKPGTEFEYSNIGAALAGYTVGVATGTSLADYAKTHIFDALKMKNTSWRLNDLDVNNIATPYTWDEDDKKLNALPLYSLSTWPDGGLRSSANDLATYLLMMLNKGEINNTRILSEDSVARMIPSNPKTQKVLTAGVFWLKLMIKNDRVLTGHGGSDPGAYTYIYYDPKQQTGIVMVANGDDGIDKDFSKRQYDTINTLLDHAKSLGRL